ncbi:MAG: YifB family Mg chelatase-like AAA ATPase [Granulosicoccaceae bacterium]
MTIAKVRARALSGVSATLVEVEVDISGGLPACHIVGLPETAVKESRDRVRSAIINAGFDFPQRRITINLAPADLPKDGGRFDLPIAIGILLASEQLPNDRAAQCEFAGELSLDGSLRSVSGALPCASACAADGHSLVLPDACAAEAALDQSCIVYGLSSLSDVVSYLRAELEVSPATSTEPSDSVLKLLDLCDVQGQFQARRALEIAAGGEHNLLMVGPPGSGKSMLAQRLPGILPPLDQQTALEVAAVHSVARGGFDSRRWRQRPFQAPHHTASGVALVGGGSVPRPGEISLAHGGVLFLDELAEFPRHVLDVLREPLENGEIHISRAARQASFPARFQLVAAMNPCPCGFYGESFGQCRCSPELINRYQSRLSGPLLDRIDLHVAVPWQDYESLKTAECGEASDDVRERVVRVRRLQIERAGVVNARLSGAVLQQVAALSDECEALIAAAASKLRLSLRSCHRIQRVARTIADLQGSRCIQPSHLAEAISFRSLK